MVKIYIFSLAGAIFCPKVWKKTAIVNALFHVTVLAIPLACEGELLFVTCIFTLAYMYMYIIKNQSFNAILVGLIQFL